MPRDFIEKTLRQLSLTLEYAGRAEASAGIAGHGLQRLDPRVKLGGFLALIFAAAASHRLETVAALLALSAALAVTSGKPVLQAVTWLWAGVFLFTGVIALPALFLTPGSPRFHLPGLPWPITETGLQSAATLLLRAGATATLAAVMVFTTPWAHLLKALRILRVPPLLVILLGMTYRFIFALVEIARHAFEARRARRVGVLPGPLQRRMAISGAAMLLSKSVQLSGEVYEAMQARGFRGEVEILDAFQMRRADWAAAALFATTAAIALEWGCLR